MPESNDFTSTVPKTVKYIAKVLPTEKNRRLNGIIDILAFFMFAIVAFHVLDPDNKLNLDANTALAYTFICMAVTFLIFMWCMKTSYLADPK